LGDVMMMVCVLYIRWVTAFYRPSSCGFSAASLSLSAFRLLRCLKNILGRSQACNRQITFFKMA
jgi:hypothetical protein